MPGPQPTSAIIDRDVKAQFCLKSGMISRG